MNPILIAQGLQILDAALSVAGNALVKAQLVGGFIQKAQAEGRTTFTADEWAQIQAVDDAGRDKLVNAIKNAVS